MSVTYPDVYPHPIEGVTVVPPVRPPLPREVLIGYELLDGPEPCCCGPCVKPAPGKLSKVAWLAVIVSAIIFWPVSCVPCCLKPAYQATQRPVYGVI